MPSYCYFCEDNQRLVEVMHNMDTALKTWGEVCYARQMPLGNTDPMASVKKMITPPNIIISAGNVELKNLGFTKLVKRDEGVYENVTATDSESRYMHAGDPSTLPDLKKKVRD